MITWNSLKTRNSLSSDFWVLSYDFLPYTYYSVTHGIMLKRKGGSCVVCEAHQVFVNDFQIRMAKKIKCKIVSMIHF